MADETDQPDESESDAEDAAKAPNRKKRARAIQRPYPRRTVEEALKIPRALKEQNGGNAWAPSEVAGAVGLGNSDSFYYMTAAARDFGLTEGTRNSATIQLTDRGRAAVYAPNADAELATLREAFFSIDIFRKVVEYYKGNRLPEERFLANALEGTFELDPRTHKEFVDLFQKNCRFLQIGADFDPLRPSNGTPPGRIGPKDSAGSGDTRTVAVPGSGEGKTLFVIMPFVERTDEYPTGFFEEVLKSLFTPAGTEAGFVVKTAKRQGSDVIQSTIVTDLLQADLVLADLTEHNPNVLFELGMRMARDLPVVLVRAKGTGRIFDVDNMLRVLDYSPHLWPSTVKVDVPGLTQHILGTWENRETAQTFMKILGQPVS